MARTISITRSFIVGSKDVLIEDNDGGFLCFYKDFDGDFVFKSTTGDGFVRFYITRKMAKELVEKLGSMIDE